MDLWREKCEGSFHMEFKILLQTDVDVVKVNAEKSGVVTLQLAVRMPFVIRSITSPTHNIKMKVMQ